MRLPVACPVALLVCSAAAGQTSLTVVRGVDYYAPQTRIVALEPSGRSVLFARSGSFPQSLYRWTAADGLGPAAEPVGGASFRFASGGGSLGAVFTGTIDGGAALWRPGGTPESLGLALADAVEEYATACTESRAFACGTSFATFSPGLGDTRAVLWTPGGSQTLGPGTPTDLSSSADVLVGYQDGLGQFFDRPLVWRESTGYLREDLPLVQAHNDGRANAVSADGTTIVGWSVESGFGAHSVSAAVWRDGVPSTLAWDGSAAAFDVDASGDTIVGRATDGLGIDHAYVHREGVGSSTLELALALEGVTVPAGVQLERADAVSPDGRVIAGFGRDASGNGVLWIASFLEVGRKACGPGGLNSSGLSGSLTARGSASVAANDLVLRAELLPPASWCALFVSDPAQAPFTRPGEPGTLCVGLPVAWFTRQGEVHPADAAGNWELAVDWPTFPSLPAFAGTGALVFQAWYRDEAGIGRGLLTDALLIDVVP